MVGPNGTKELVGYKAWTLILPITTDPPLLCVIAYF